MKILILENDQYMVESKTVPIVGRHYSLEDAESGSKAQNNTFHALISCLYKWMLYEDNFIHDNGGIIYDFRCANDKELKKIFKQRYGAGADHYEYVNNDYAMVEVKTKDDIPQYAWDSFNSGNKGRIKQILKSWIQYSKKQRTNLIDMTKSVMDHIGVDSKKYFEILEGMEDESN